jgi:hypothetical protein
MQSKVKLGNLCTSGRTSLRRSVSRGSLPPGGSTQCSGLSGSGAHPQLQQHSTQHEQNTRSSKVVAFGYTDDTGRQKSSQAALAAGLRCTCRYMCSGCHVKTHALSGPTQPHRSNSTAMVAGSPTVLSTVHLLHSLAQFIFCAP